MEYIFGILIIIVVVWVLFVGVGTEITPKEKQKRKNDELVEMELPAIEPVREPDYKMRHQTMIAAIAQLEEHQKASIVWDRRKGWHVQFDGDEKLYGGGQFITSVLDALYVRDELEKYPDCHKDYHAKNSPPPPPEPPGYIGVIRG